MSVTRRFTVAISLAFIAVQPANACLYPPPPPRIEGESDEAWQKRAANALGEHVQSSMKAGEARDFDEARSVFFGRIIKSEEIETSGSKFGRRAEVEPLAAIKGPLPENRTTLRTVELTSCGFEGGGRAVWGEVGSLAIIFDGVEPYGFKDLTVDSVLAREVQDERIVAAMNEFVAEHTEYRAEPK